MTFALFRRSRADYSCSSCLESMQNSVAADASVFSMRRSSYSSEHKSVEKDDSCRGRSVSQRSAPVESRETSKRFVRSTAPMI